MKIIAFFVVVYDYDLCRNIYDGRLYENNNQSHNQPFALYL